MGLFVAIEGSDGTGKATQALELEVRALAKGYDVLHVGFPRYGEPSARFIEHYLNGKYGPANSVHPEIASMLYAADRYGASETIRKHLRKRHALVISDRYVASNLAHQGTKFEDKDERHAFYERIIELEYDTFGIPQPDLNILLVVPVTTAQKNVDSKPTRSYTAKKRDIHEADASHLEKATANYQELARLYPDRFAQISCMEPDSKAMRSVTDIGNDVWDTVLPLLHDRA